MRGSQSRGQNDLPPRTSDEAGIANPPTTTTTMSTPIAAEKLRMVRGDRGRGTRGAPALGIRSSVHGDVTVSPPRVESPAETTGRPRRERAAPPRITPRVRP